MRGIGENRRWTMDGRRWNRASAPMVHRLWSVVAYMVRRPWSVVVLLLLLPSPSQSHHILGIPHYAYDEQYPQTPILTYRVQTGRYDLKMTGYPGHPTPQERTSLHVYLKDVDTGSLFDGNVTLTVYLDRLIGEDPVIYGPIEAEIEERVFKFYPEFPEAANYTARVSFHADGEPWDIDLPMVAGEPGSPWTVLGIAGGGLVLFLLSVRAARIKMKRRQNTLRRSASSSEEGVRA